MEIYLADFDRFPESGEGEITCVLPRGYGACVYTDAMRQVAQCMGGNWVLRQDRTRLFPTTFICFEQGGIALYVK